MLWRLNLKNAPQYMGFNESFSLGYECYYLTDAAYSIGIALLSGLEAALVYCVTPTTY